MSKSDPENKSQNNQKEKTREIRGRGENKQKPNTNNPKWKKNQNLPAELGVEGELAWLPWADTLVAVTAVLAA